MAFSLRDAGEVRRAAGALRGCIRSAKSGSRHDPTWAFLTEMRSLGHGAAERWPAENLAAVAARAIVELAKFEGPRVEAPSSE